MIVNSQNTISNNPFVSRAGLKLKHALDVFKIDVNNLVCADFGCSTGGFTDCLLQNGAEKVYAIDTGYGCLDWGLRNNKKVIVMERTNAMHVDLPEKVDFLTIDTSWTKQINILPNAKKNLKKDGKIITLIKPHYEAPHLVRKGKLPEEEIENIVNNTIKEIEKLGFKVLKTTKSPIKGRRAANEEYLCLIRTTDS